VVVLVSHEHHCLADLLIRHTFGELNVNMLAVLSTHDTLGPLVKRFDVPFHHISHVNLERQAHEAELLRIIDGYDPEFLVLAKYMRLLTPAFVRRYPARIVNIHHSFLLVFVVAWPYYEAFERGVEVIVASATFVNADYDYG